MGTVAAVPAPGDAETTFYADGPTRPSVTFEAAEAGTVRIRVLRADDGAVVHERDVDAVAGTNIVSWSGRAEHGRAPGGRYLFDAGDSTRRVVTVGAEPFTLRDHRFPIRGEHDLGRSASNRFGGGRAHQGQDMFAACGTPVIAARGGRVRSAGYHAAGGHYAVITSEHTGLDYVYMHLRSPARVDEGDPVTTGQRIGDVGDTGRASGCHLHFELWSAPGWYAGGSPFDPLPRLRAWDGGS